MRIAFSIVAAVPLISLVFAHPEPQRGRGGNSGPVCGVKGYDEKTKAYYDITARKLASVQACGAHCVASSKCLSFAVGNGACLHYKVAV
jgi:hypothetical protein